MCVYMCMCMCVFVCRLITGVIELINVSGQIGKFRDSNKNYKKKKI